jgi:hypothetical protein
LNTREATSPEHPISPDNMTLRFASLSSIE